MLAVSDQEYSSKGFIRHLVFLDYQFFEGELVLGKMSTQYKMMVSSGVRSWMVLRLYCALQF